MNERRTFLVEILLRAREEISKAAQKAAQAIQGVTKAQDDHTQAAKEATSAQDQQTQSLEQLVEAHTREKKGAKESAAAIRELAAQRRQQALLDTKEIESLNERIRVERAYANERRNQSREEIAELRLAAAEQIAATGKRSKATKQLLADANLLQAQADQESASSARRVDTMGLEIAARRSNADSMRREASELENMAKSAETNRRPIRAFFTDMRQGARDADVNLSKLGADFRGFKIALVIKYAQSLITAFLALGTTLLNVAQSAIQAGIALGAAFVAGAAQALPVIGVLVAAFSRLAAVLQAVKLFNQQQLLESHNASAEAERQRAATERVTNAQEQLADAHRAVLKAQEDLTKARKDARLELEDLIDAEKRSILSVEDAQDALRRAIAAGDVSGVASAQLDLSSARRDATRAHVAAAPTRSGGIEATDQVKNATDALVQAKRNEERASHDLATARLESARAATQETSAVDRLQAMLDRLTPAERGLYRAILRIQETFRQNVRPITDILVGAFTHAVDRINKLLQDQSILNSFRKIADALAKAFNGFLDVITSKQGRGFFSFIADEAAKNIPLVAEIFQRSLKIIQNIARAASPAFRDLLKLIIGFLKDLGKESENTEGLSNFFRTGIRYLGEWVKLGASIIDFFLALSGAGGAKAGTDAIEAATKKIREAAAWIRKHSDEVAAFFQKALKVTGVVLRTVAAVGAALIELFKPQTVEAFASFIQSVLVPALVVAVKVMGELVSIFHAFFSLPGVSEVTALAGAFLLLGKGMLILRGAVVALRGILFATVGAFGPVGAAILAIVAAIVLLDRKFHFLRPTLEWLKNAFKDTFEFLKKVSQPVFEWIKKAAQDVVDWFKDVWNQGLLKWLRWPIEQFVKINIAIWKGIFRFFEGVIGWFSDHLGEGSAFAKIVDFLSWPFKAAFNIIKTTFGAIKDIIKLLLDVIAGRFGKVGHDIANLFSGIFNGLKDMIIGTLNTIIDGINIAIDGLNAINPFSKIHHVPKIGEHKRDQPIQGDSAANVLRSPGGTLGGFPGSSASPNFAEGGVIPAKRGGQMIVTGEAGYDEVVLTTDPRHADRQKGLLLEYLKQMAPHFAEGGWVQGARPTPPGYLITRLANSLFKAGYSVTNAMNFRSGHSYHPAGMAIDFGDSVNNLNRLWSILFPARRGFTELFGPKGLYHGTARFSDPDLQAGHMDHIHVAIAELGARLGAGLARILRGNLSAVAGLPKVLRQSSRALIGQDPSKQYPGTLLAGLSPLWHSAQQIIGNLRRKAVSFLGGGQTDDPTITGRGQGQALMRDISRRRGWNFPDWWALDASETGHGTNEVNPTSTARLRGQFLDFNWGKYGPGSDPRQNPTMRQQILSMAEYIAERYRNPTAAWAFHKLHGWYQSGGDVPGSGPQTAVLHGGEHVWTAREVERAGGHKVMYALRKMFGGGGQGGPEGYQDGGRVKFQEDQASTLIINAMNELATRVRSIFRRVFAEGGVFDKMVASVEGVATKAALKLQQFQFHVGPGGAFRTPVSAVDLARRNIGVLQDQRTGLQGEAKVLFGASQDANRAVAQAQARLAQTKKGTKAYKAAQEALQQAQGLLNSVNIKAAENTAALAQNAQDQVEATEAFQQALLDAVNNTASDSTSALDRMTRMAAALGHSLSAQEIGKRSEAILRKQRADLEAVLAEATRTGNTELAKTVKDQMDELDVQIAESVAGQFQASIDEVNNRAQEGLAANDRRQRLAQIGGTNYGLLGAALEDRGNVLKQQRNSLAELLAQAQAAGNIDQVKNLTSALDDLDVTIAENSQAVKDNTDAAFSARVGDVNSAFSFSSSVISSATQFFQGLAAITGSPMVAQVIELTKSQGTALETQRSGLLSALADLLGYSGAEKDNLTKLSGQDLVNMLLTLTSGPVYQSILERLDPKQKEDFQNLITSLLANANATNENTQALMGLTASTTQGFSSTAWQWYRNAIFNGAGGLLPQYQYPSMDVGGSVLTTGLARLHAGEVVTPASVVRGGGGQGDFNLTVVNEEKTVDMDSETLANRAYFRWRNSPSTG